MSREISVMLQMAPGCSAIRLLPGVCRACHAATFRAIARASLAIAREPNTKTVGDRKNLPAAKEKNILS